MAPRVQQSIYKKSSFETDKRVTRSQTAQNPRLDLQPAPIQPKLVKNKPRNKQSSFQTERRVTRSQTTQDPRLDLQPPNQPQSNLVKNKPRNVNQPWINIVVKELLAREPNMNRVAAMKKAGKMIRTATEQEKERWRKLAEKPKPEEH